MSINRDFERLEPEFAQRLKAAIDLANHDSRTRDGKSKFPGFARWALFEGFRSAARQKALYAQGRTAPGQIVTWRRRSRHQDGVAGDVCWIDTEGAWRWDGPARLWAILGHCARANGLAWGGDWDVEDLPHIEMPE